jgi:hypothetical protein
MYANTWKALLGHVSPCGQCMSKESSSLPTWTSLTIINPCIVMVFNLHELQKNSTFWLIQLHFGGGGTLDQNDSLFFGTKVIINEKKTNIFSNHVFQYHGPLLRKSFVMWTTLCIQVMEKVLWAIECEGQIIFNFWSLNKQNGLIKFTFKRMWMLSTHSCMVVSIFKNCIKDIGVW